MDKGAISPSDLENLMRYTPLTEAQKRQIIAADNVKYFGKKAASDQYKKEACATISRLVAEGAKKTVMDNDDKALQCLVAMPSAKRATAFERESKGESMGINDRVVELHHNLQIPKGQEQRERNAIKDYWNRQHHQL